MLKNQALMAVKGFIFAVISLITMVAVFMNIEPFFEVNTTTKEHTEATNVDTETDHTTQYMMITMIILSSFIIKNYVFPVDEEGN